MREGFRRERTFTGRRSAAGLPIGPAWHVASDPMGFYYHRLSRTLKRTALTRGFRLRARLALREGNGFVNVDLVPDAGRFDLNFFVRPGAQAAILLMRSSMPREGEWIDYGAPGPLPLVEFVYDPATRAARYLVNGRAVRTGYTGYRQYQEDFGLFWGTTDDVGVAQRGAADFSLAWLTIR